MIFKGPGIFGFGSSLAPFPPSPVSKLSLDRRHTGRQRKRDYIYWLTGEGGNGWARSQIIRRRKRLVSINHSMFYAVRHLIQNISRFITGAFFLLFLTKSYDADNAWSSINHSLFYAVRHLIHISRFITGAFFSSFSRQIIRRRKCLVLYKSFNVLYTAMRHLIQNMPRFIKKRCIFFLLFLT
jgi:hypothetical protein